MRLREHVLAVEFPEDRLRGFRRNAKALRPGEELLPVLLDELVVVLAPEGAAQAVGLAGGKAGHIYGQLVDLVLEQHYAQRAFQRPLLLGAIVGNWFPLAAPRQVLLNAVVDAHAGADGAHLVRHVQQVARL